MLDPTGSSASTQSTAFRTRWQSYPTGAAPRRGWRRALGLLAKVVCWTYLRLFHDFRFRYHPLLPKGGPYICVISHTSFLDVPCLMAADPYNPPTSMVIKSEMVRLPLLGKLLDAWGTIPVDRQGQDIAALRRIRKVLAEGRGICVAPAGTRSIDGRLGPINPVLMRLLLQSNAPVFPVTIVGAYECLPKGARLPRPGPIYLDSGPEIDLRSFRGRRLNPDELQAAATMIRDGLNALLPDSMKTAPDTPILGTYGSAP